MSRKYQVEGIVDRLDQPIYGVASRRPSVSRLVGSPGLLPGESFWSWCSRIREYFGVTDLLIKDLFQINSPFYLIDVGMSDLDTDFLASVVMQSTCSLISLRWPAASNDSLSILGCLTALPLLRLPVIRYCPNCLCEDIEPYFRQFWRFVFAYVCPLHGCVLRDFCPQCHEMLGVSHFKSRSGTSSLRFCASCSGDLASVEPVLLPDHLAYLVIQNQLVLANLVSPGADFLISSMGSRRDGNFDFATRDGVLDLTSPKNVFKLYMSMLSMTLTNPGAEDLRSRFSPYIFNAYLSSQCEVPLGLDGWAIFRDGGDAIRDCLSKCQTVTCGTFWSSHPQNTFLEHSSFRKNIDLQEAMAWIQSLISGTADDVVFR